MPDQPRLLNALFTAAVNAALPARVLPGYLPAQPKGRTIVIGAGKASAAMAQVLEQHWPAPLSGLVLTRYGHGAACDLIEIVEAAHPIPDEAGYLAAGRILELVDDLGVDDLVLCLISGGGSALLTVPAAGISLAEKQHINRQLLACGAPIDEMNCLRKHLSAIKGGRLAQRAHPAKLVSLLISDVPGDDPGTIASGPTIADATTCADALAIIEKYALDVPEHIRAGLMKGVFETPKPADAVFSGNQVHLIATPRLSLDAAANQARAQGYSVLDLGDDLEGEARALGAAHAEMARAIADRAGHTKPPVVMLSGGETTVTLKGNGRGGRNAEYALALAIGLAGHRQISAIACDSDGIDGSQDNAGAFILPDTMGQAKQAGLDPQAYLDNNDAYGFFQKLGQLVVTGPTLTNVNDFRAIVIEEG